jgi:plastocyanin
MKIALSMLAVTWTLFSGVQAGTISGTVRAERKGGATNDAACGDAYKQSRALKFAEVKNYEDEHEFVVCIVGQTGTNVAAPEKPVQVVTSKKISQRGAMFSPHVLPILVGTTVEWPNYDEILHNVFSMSEPKPFDLDLYKAPTIKSVTFDKPGRVDVYCSIHAAMSCVVLVMENPFFSGTDAKGRYTIPNVPAGSYKLKAWYERLPAEVKEITVPETGDVKMDFVLTVKGLPRI